MSFDAGPTGAVAASASGTAPASSTLPLDDFARIFNDAKERYRTNTGHDLEDAPFAAELRGCVSVEDIIQILDNRDKAFEAFRAHGKKFRKVIEPVVRVVQFFLETGSEVAAAVSHLLLPFLRLHGADFGVQIDWGTRR